MTNVIIKLQRSKFCNPTFREADAGNVGGDMNIPETQTYVIREIYESENSIGTFLMQLERALHSKYKYIVIEPLGLGQETGRWIMLGNILSRLSVASGLVSITTSVVWPDHLYVSVPLATLAFITQGFYDISWYFDPCSKYQVVKPGNQQVAQYVDESVAKSATKILVYKDNTLLNYAQRSVTIAAVVLCGLRLYRSLK